MVLKFALQLKIAENWTDWGSKCAANVVGRFIKIGVPSNHVFSCLPIKKMTNSRGCWALLEFHMFSPSWFASAGFSLQVKYNRPEVGGAFPKALAGPTNLIHDG
jgi:hypothetical protein